MPTRYFNALAGAGKARALARYANRLARRGIKVLIVQPTRHLIERTVTEEIQALEPAYSVRAIHSDTALETNSIIGDIVDHFRTTDRNRGEVLFITHAAFFKVPYFEMKGDWVLLMDEAPQVDEFKEYLLPDTHHLITPYLTLLPGGPVYGLLVANEDLLPDDRGGRGMSMEKIARNKHGDDVLKHFGPLAHRVNRGAGRFMFTRVSTSGSSGARRRTAL